MHAFSGPKSAGHFNLPDAFAVLYLYNVLAFFLKIFKALRSLRLAVKSLLFSGESNHYF